MVFLYPIDLIAFVAEVCLGDVFQSMLKRSAATVVAVACAVLVTYAQAGRQLPAAPPQPTLDPRAAAPATPAAAPRLVRASAPAQPAVSDDEQRAFFKQYCMVCHSERAKAAGMDSARK